MTPSKLVVAVTGASGAIYAQRFLIQAARQCESIYLTLSDQAIDVAMTELGVAISRTNFDTLSWLGERFSNIHLLDARNYFTPPASGSFRHDGMVILPCSMGTAGRIANGISNDLTTRAADVCLKEGRKLVLVPREMPWNLIHMRNMTTLVEAGATVIPASPAWYQKPKTLEDLADTVVARVMQSLGMEHNLMPQWMVEE
ncbi:MAG: UbiX family flavin prenyltransferase [Armatimonadetes bacterium]|nr:UbiX family flavin prenyltransferase [Armatimonadota bacterium]